MGPLTVLQEVKREVPPNLHVTGPTGCDYSVNFPPPLEDAQLLAFLDAAAGVSAGM